MSPDRAKCLLRKQNLSPPNTHTVTHGEPLSQLDELRHLPNECRQTRMQFLVSLLTARVVFLGKELNPSEPQFPHVYSGMDEIHVPGAEETT